MKTNLSSQITLTRIPLRYYRPENAYEQSVLTRMEKIPTNIYESAEEGSFVIAKNWPHKYVKNRLPENLSFSLCQVDVPLRVYLRN